MNGLRWKRSYGKRTPVKVCRTQLKLIAFLSRLCVYVSLPRLPMYCLGLLNNKVNCQLRVTFIFHLLTPILIKPSFNHQSIFSFIFLSIYVAWIFIIKDLPRILCTENRTRPSHLCILLLILFTVSGFLCKNLILYVLFSLSCLSSSLHQKIA